MWILHHKMKRLSNTLSKWSKEEFWYIFKTVREFEGKVKEAEEMLIQNHSVTNRQKPHDINAEYIRYLKLEGVILKQKSQLHWYKERNTNSKFFHYWIKGRRTRIFIHRSNDNEDQIQGDENIGKAAWQYLHEVFKGDTRSINVTNLKCIFRMLAKEQNDRLSSKPTMNELQKVVFV